MTSVPRAPTAGRDRGASPLAVRTSSSASATTSGRRKPPAARTMTVAHGMPSRSAATTVPTSTSSATMTSGRQVAARPSIRAARVGAASRTNFSRRSASSRARSTASSGLDRGRVRARGRRRLGRVRVGLRVVEGQVRETGRAHGLGHPAPAGHADLVPCRDRGSGDGHERIEVAAATDEREQDPSACHRSGCSGSWGGHRPSDAPSRRSALPSRDRRRCGSRSAPRSRAGRGRGTRDRGPISRTSRSTSSG